MPCEELDGLWGSKLRRLAIAQKTYATIPSHSIGKSEEGKFFYIGMIQCYNKKMIVLPKSNWELLDARKVKVGIRPALSGWAVTFNQIVKMARGVVRRTLPTANAIRRK